MLKCYLKNISNNSVDHLTDVPIEVHDDNEFSIKLDVTNHELKAPPVVMVGDFEIGMHLVSQQGDGTCVYESNRGSFFDNAFFLNYFGQCELSVSLDNIITNYIIDVNVTSYKAGIAKEMLSFLSENTDDILQTCYSKTQVGFSHKRGKDRKLIKLLALTQTIDLIESVFPLFKSDIKHEIEHKLQYYSNKPIVVDDSSASWLSENMDELVLSNSNQSELRIKQKYYQVDIPNSVTFLNTDTKENRVLHQFVSVALKYLIDIRKGIAAQANAITDSEEYNEYVKFDQVIKGMINPVLMMRLKAVDLLIKRIERIHLFFKINMPVKKITGEMPIQTSYSLRHKHYARSFSKIADFYNSSDTDRGGSEFLLGLRNLSQLFELCCLYSMVCYFKKISDPVTTSWLSKSLEWESKEASRLNVLGNSFVFENEYYEYTLLYEKRFYSFSKDTMNLQIDNLVRIDKSNNYRDPDFTIKVRNKHTNDFYFIILDAKFSRRYKMISSKPDKVPSVLQTVFTKYSTNLKTYKNGELVDLTRYVGVVFGLSKSEEEQGRVHMFNKIHDVDGLAPIFPFAAADFISFDRCNENIEGILSKYISQ
jgi:hypothetical protein